MLHTYFNRHIIWTTKPAFMSRIADTVQALEITTERRGAIRSLSQSKICPRLLIEPVRGRECYDKKDKVYGILGLRNLQEPEKWRCGSAQDGRLIEHISMDLAMQVMEHDQNLDVFSRCCLNNSKTIEYDLPSWTKDWSVSARNCPRMYFSSPFRQSGSSIRLYATAIHVAPVWHF